MKSSSVNVVVTTGNLVEAPELKSSNGGVDYVHFRIGTNRRWKDGSGDEQERADFFDVVTFNGTARGVAKASKGTEVLIHGRLQLNQWEAADGSPRQRVEIVAETVKLLRKPKAQRAAATE